MKESERNDWLRWDADMLEQKAESLLVAYKWDKRLPYPCADRIRQAHEKLGRIVAAMDAEVNDAA